MCLIIATRNVAKQYNVTSSSREFSMHERYGPCYFRKCERIQRDLQRVHWKWAPGELQRFASVFY